jgi:hypothetical protein
MVVADMPVVSGPSVRLSLVRDVHGGLVVDQDGGRNAAEATGIRGIRGNSQVNDDSEGSDVDGDQIGIETDASEPEEIDDIILDVLDALADADADADADAVSSALYVDDRATEDADNVSLDVVGQADQVVPGE